MVGTWLSDIKVFVFCLQILYLDVGQTYASLIYLVTTEKSFEGCLKIWANIASRLNRVLAYNLVLDLPYWGKR